MQRNFLWFQLDDLAFKLLLVGLGLVLALLFAFSLFLWLWQRHRRAIRRVKDVETEKSKTLSDCFKGAPDHYAIGNKAEAFFVVPIERNGTTTTHNVNSFANGNGGKNSTQQHKLSNGFSAFFQGSPPRTPKNVQQSPLSPSPLNPTDYLDLMDEQLDEGPRSMIQLLDNNSGRIGNGSLGSVNQKSPAGRKDSVRPANSIQIGEQAAKEQKLSLKNRPFKIIVNDDSQLDDGTGGNNFGGDFKMAPKESPLMMRRFTSTMEKVPESENERIYGEFETLNQQSMCTLRPRSSSAELPENMRKNRFYDILPFEFNRVKLRWANSAYGGTDGRSDFINASYIQTEDGQITYIAAQGPIGPEEADGGRRLDTVRDFWEMVWQEQINCIVMLTQTREGIRQKCAQYWPDCPGESDQHGTDFSVHLYCVTEDDICFQRELWLRRRGQPERKVLQWHFKEWHDAAGPSEVQNLLTFMDSVRASAKRRPMLVHCSAGVGRSGVFIALDILLEKLEKEHIIDVKDTVSRLRNQRTNMVQNAEQYVALYEAIALAISKKSRTSG